MSEKQQSKKKRLAIALGISIPVAVAGITTGIVFGVKGCKSSSDTREVEVEESKKSEAQVESKTTSEGLEITISAKSAAKIVDTVSIKIGDKTLEPTEYTFDKATGKITIKKEVLDKNPGKIVINPSLKDKVLSGIKVSESTKVLKQKTSFQIHADLLYSNADEKITWTVEEGKESDIQLSSTESTSGQDITVTAADVEETVELTATCGSYSDTCTIDICDPEVVQYVEVDPSETEIALGETKTLTATIYPSTAPQTVTWGTYEESIATVDQNGVVKAVGYGRCWICAKSTQNDEPGYCVVTVPAPKQLYIGEEYSPVRENECLVKQGDNTFSESSITIPEKLIVNGKEKTVTGVSDDGFKPSGISQIRNFTFAKPSNITYIGSNAFNGNEYLESFEFPANVTKLNSNCFTNCTNLQTFIFASGSKLETIDANVFDVCASLTSITLPASLNTIAINAFVKSKFTSIKFENTSKWRLPDEVDYLVVTNDGDNATNLKNGGSWCSKGITTIDPVCFNVKDNPTPTTCTVELNELGQKVTDTLTVPETIDGLTVVGIGAYGLSSGKGSQAKEVKFAKPSNITTIAEYAFTQNHSIETINIPGTVKTIKDSAFHDCTSLKNLTLNEGLETIEDSTSYGAFYGCTSLETLTIPASVQTIGTKAFIRAGSKSNGLTVTFANNSTLKTISDHAFYNANLTSISLPKSIETIGEDAFGACTMLETVDIPSDAALTSLGTSAFENCSALTSITIPTSLTFIPNKAFDYCSNLKSATFADPNYWFIQSLADEIDWSDPTVAATKLIGWGNKFKLPFTIKSTGTTITATAEELNDYLVLTPSVLTVEGTPSARVFENYMTISDVTLTKTSITGGEISLDTEGHTVTYDDTGKAMSISLKLGTTPVVPAPGDKYTLSFSLTYSRTTPVGEYTHTWKFENYTLEFA